MILPPMPGYRRPTSEAQQDKRQPDFPSAARGISVPVHQTYMALKKISGNMILRATRGRRKPTSGEQRDMVQPDFPSAAKGISVPATMAAFAFLQRISGNILPRATAERSN